jgi:hypothetical protein
MKSGVEGSDTCMYDGKGRIKTSEMYETREGKGREGKGREGKGREKGSEAKRREGKGGKGGEGFKKNTRDVCSMFDVSLSRSCFLLFLLLSSSRVCVTT